MRGAPVDPDSQPIDDAKLLQKPRDLEALFAGATTAGERVAAGNAKERILDRLPELEKADPPVPYQFSLPDPWCRKFFMVLVRRYGLTPYRERGQRLSTVMVARTRVLSTSRCSAKSPAHGRAQVRRALSRGAQSSGARQRAHRASSSWSPSAADRSQMVFV